MSNHAAKEPNVKGSNPCVPFLFSRLSILKAVARGQELRRRRNSFAHSQTLSFICGNVWLDKNMLKMHLRGVANIKKYIT